VNHLEAEAIQDA
jgi:hypothetical protein